MRLLVESKEAVVAKLNATIQALQGNNELLKLEADKLK